MSNRSAFRPSWPRIGIDIFGDRGLGRRGRWILFSAVIGAVSGIGAIAFDMAFRVAEHLLLGGIGGFRPPGSGIEDGAGFGPDSPWMLPVALVAGGLLSGLIVVKLAPEAEGHGTDAVIRSFHHLRGTIRRRVPFVKAIASAITIGSGGSAGREGPIAQIGAGFGSFLGDVLRLTNQDRRIMMMAGAAGGIGAIFRAPLGAALFSAEVLYSKPEFEYEVLLPGLISSITGYSIYSSYAGWGYLFDVPEMSFHTPLELLVYAMLGISCAAAGAVFPRVFYGVRDRVFRKLAVPAWLKPAVGALALGLIAVVFPEALGMGYGYIQQAIDHDPGIGFLLAFAAIKMIATSLTISSGGSGGVFGPSLVIGGALGAAFGDAAAAYLPGIAPAPAACIMVGMGGFFAGVAKTPFAAVIMVMEMTGSYGLLVPSLLVATLAYLCLPLGIRLYENQVPSRPDSPAHLGSFAVEVMRQTHLRDSWTPSRFVSRTVRPSATLREAADLASGMRQNLLPVVDERNRLVGEVSIDDIRRALLSDEGEGEGPKTAEEIMRRPVGPVVPDDTLAAVARFLASRRTDTVTVVRSRNDPEVIGTFSRRELILAYGRELERLREAEGAHPLAADEPF